MTYALCLILFDEAGSFQHCSEHGIPVKDAERSEKAHTNMRNDESAFGCECVHDALTLFSALLIGLYAVRQIPNLPETGIQGPIILTIPQWR
jgi:hypothetical protein